jgi:hypothetical protein
MNSFDLTQTMDNLNGFDEFLKYLKTNKPFLVGAHTEDGNKQTTYDITNLVRSLYSELTDEINKNEENAFYLTNDKYDDKTQERMMKKYSYVKEKYLSKIVTDSDGKVEYVDIFDHEVYYIKGMKLLIEYLYENLITFNIVGRINAFLTLKNAINKVNALPKDKKNE